MKMFLTGEGPTDCGCRPYNQHTWEDGPIQVYIRKIAPDVEIETFSREDIKKESAKRDKKWQSLSRRGITGHGKRAFFIAQLASQRGCDIIAMYVDADKETGSTQKTRAACQSRYDDIKDQVLTGLQQGGAKKPLAIVPMKMIECWLLGDRLAFQSSFDVMPTERLFKDPELLWGDEHNPDSGYPKNQLRKALAECGESPSQETYVLIAGHSDVERLCSGCPISFADFVQQLRSISA